jgi:hypothetical protein
MEPLSIAAEIDVDRPNKASLRLHEKAGIVERFGPKGPPFFVAQ